MSAASAPAPLPMPGRLLPAQASFHLLLGSDYSPWRGMDSVWTGSWGHCPYVGGGKPFSIHLPADFQPALACSSLWLQAGECSGSWSWHWASVAVTPQREQAASRTEVLQVKGSLSIAGGHCTAMEIAALSGRCQLGMEISCGGHGGTSQGFSETIRWQFPE